MCDGEGTAMWGKPRVAAECTCTEREFGQCSRPTVRSGRTVNDDRDHADGSDTRPRGRRTGIDAPICQDTRSGSQVCGLARSVVCHHALKDLAGEKAFETADDLPFGPPFSGASFDVVEGW